MTCQNCKSKLTCGCQKRVASDKKEVCSNCLAAYEALLNKNKGTSTSTSPTNVQVTPHPQPFKLN